MHRAAHLGREIALTRAILRGRPMRKVLPRQQPPAAIVLEYYQWLRGLMERAKAEIDRRLVAELPRLLEARRFDRSDLAIDAERQDREDVNKLVDQISEDYFKDLRPAELDHRARTFAARTNAWQREQLRRQTRAAFGVDVLTAEPNLAARVGDFAAENVALIKSVPNQYFDQVEAVVTRGVRQGTRHEDLVAEIAKRGEVSLDRAKLIARDQVLTLYADINRARQEAMGLKRYVWRTVSDGRVRPEHEARDGETYEWDDPPDGETPGSAVNCRCWAEPDFSEVLASL